jgi:PAS domain S-box-containing protein
LLDKFVQSIHPEDAGRVVAAVEHAVHSGEDYEADYRVVQADSAVRWVTARGRSERDGAGRPVRMRGVLVDITARKELEQELRVQMAQLAEADRSKQQLLMSLKQSEEKLRLLADTIPQLAWMAEPDGSIFWYNQRWYDYTGTLADQMTGSGWQSVHDPALLPQVLDQWKASVAGGQAFEMVFPLKGADGQFRPFLTRVNPLRAEDGHMLYWFGTNTDISDIKRMEQTLLETDRRKDEFLATLAHELRNPLAPIRNSLEILKMPRVDAATFRKTRDMMERQVHHLVRLVDDLLDVSRVMRGKIDLRKEPVELSTIVARAVETVQSLIEVQGQRLSLSLPQESLLIDGDPVRLAQVVGNLLTNSAKYTEVNGHIWLSARLEGKDMVLSVRDDGIGIAPDMLPHVFELFVQADNASTKAQGGLGIGLTLVRNLVEMHGGTVTASSAGLGKGSEFSVRLPLMAHDPAEQNSKADSETGREVASSGRRLLVVDDNQDAAISLAMLLRMLGHDVQTAHDGASALTLAVSYRPDMVFLDIGMPGMDGYEVARRLREQPGLEAVVLTALTGWGQKADRLRTADAGFDHHLVKPLETKVLKELLDDLYNTTL